MDVEKILRTGYFDRLKITGVLKPVYESDGTVLMPNSSLKESLNKSDEAYKNGVAHLCIQFIGECDTNISSSEIIRMREDRENCGLIKIPSSPDVDRYEIAYIDILIIKSDYALPYKIESNGKTEKDIEKLAKTSDMLEIMLVALDIGDYIHKQYNYSKDWVNIAIINKVYVKPVFRRCGISSWIHSNIADIINMYGLVFPTGVILTYGDFSHESNKEFGMSNGAYNKMLLNHYKSMGYSNIRKLPIKNSMNTQTILYRLFV